MSAVDLAIVILFTLALVGLTYWLVSIQINELIRKYNDAADAINEEFTTQSYRLLALETEVMRLKATTKPSPSGTVRPLVPGRPIPPRNPDPKK